MDTATVHCRNLCQKGHLSQRGTIHWLWQTPMGLHNQIFRSPALTEHHPRSHQAIQHPTIGPARPVPSQPHHYSPPTHPATLYDLLSPKLLHQHSLLTAVQQLLQPITHLPSIPIETLTKLHATLRDSPRLMAHLPPSQSLDPDPPVLPPFPTPTLINPK